MIRNIDILIVVSCNVVYVITVLAVGFSENKDFLVILTYSLKIDKNHMPKIHIDENIS